MTTTTLESTPQSVLNKAAPNLHADALAKIKVGNVLSPIKVTFASLTAAAAIDITTADSKAAATIVGFTPALASGQNLPAIGQVVTCRVTAGTAATGDRQITDAGGSASTSVAILSDDGKTLTFEANVTGFVLTYFPRAEGITDTSFPEGAP